jgi:hypothetical protein
VESLCGFDEELFDLHKLTGDLGQPGKFTIVINLIVGVAWIRKSNGEERSAIIGTKDYCLHV